MHASPINKNHRMRWASRGIHMIYRCTCVSSANHTKKTSWIFSSTKLNEKKSHERVKIARETFVWTASFVCDDQLVMYHSVRGRQLKTRKSKRQVAKSSFSSLNTKYVIPYVQLPPNRNKKRERKREKNTHHKTRHQ